MKERIEYLDALKAVSILLVVFCHMPLLPAESLAGNALMCMAWCAVPCFMMISGVLMHQTKTFVWDKYFRRLGRTYIVFAIWRLIYLLVNIVGKSLHFSFAQIFSYLFLITDLEGVDTGVFWYMIAYLIVMFLYPATWHLFQTKEGKKALAVLGAAAGVSGVLIPSGSWVLHHLAIRTGLEEISLNSLNRILPVTNYSFMVFYFIFGAFLYAYQQQIAEKIKNKSWLPAVMIIVGLAGLIVIKRLDTGSWRWASTYLSGGYQRIMTLLLSAGLYLFFCCSKSQKGFHFLAAYIGRYTMGIYYMHYLMLDVCRVLIYPQLTQYSSFLLNCAKTLAVTAVCVILTIMLRKIPGVRNLVK